MRETLIKPSPPFDFAATARFMRFTEAEIVDIFKGERYRRALHFNERLHLLTVESRGTLARPLLTVSLSNHNKETAQVESNAIAAAATALVRQMFSADHDLGKFRARIKGDLLMQRIEAAHRGLHIARWPSLFEALTISILSQQISTVVAMTLKRRLVEKFGARLMVNGDSFHAFPRAETLAGKTIDELRALGISGAKAMSITEMAKLVASGELDEKEMGNHDNETVIAGLTRLRGVGRWTAEWALMLYFGRADVFPAGDLALRGFVVKYYNDGAAMTERDIRALAHARWGEWSSYAAIYLLAGMRAGIINLQRERVLLSNQDALSVNSASHQQKRRGRKTETTR